MFEKFLSLKQDAKSPLIHPFQNKSRTGELTGVYCVSSKPGLVKVGHHHFKVINPARIYV